MDNPANEHGDQPEAEVADSIGPAENPPQILSEAAPVRAQGELGAQPADEATGGLDIGSQPAEPEPRRPHIIRGKIEADGTAVSTGRRKTAVARVRVRKGTGKVIINNRAFEEY